MKYAKYLILFLLSLNVAQAQLAPTNPPPAQIITFDAPSPIFNIANYNIYYGNSTGFYTNKINIGTNTVYTLSLLRGATYFAAATSTDINGLESDFSNEITFTVPSLPPAPTNLRLFAYDPIAQSIYGIANEFQLLSLQKTEEFNNWTNITDLATDDNGVFYYVDNNTNDYAFYRLQIK